MNFIKKIRHCQGQYEGTGSDKGTTTIMVERYFRKITLDSLYNNLNRINLNLHIGSSLVRTLCENKVLSLQLITATEINKPSMATCLKTLLNGTVSFSIADPFISRERSGFS